MGRVFNNPMILLIVLLVIVVLFGAPKLPGAARSLGRSLRIFRSEIHRREQGDRPGSSSAAAARPGGAQGCNADSSSSPRDARPVWGVEAVIVGNRREGRLRVSTDAEGTGKTTMGACSR
jgi:TatA/E family protein of Tat protein translocase